MPNEARSPRAPEPRPTAAGRELERDRRRGSGSCGSGIAAAVRGRRAGRACRNPRVQAAGDATITVALASTLFFSVPTHEARGRVALYLLITMLPFAVVAPVLGPALDRFRRGRRIALALTMIARAVLALVIATA